MKKIPVIIICLFLIHTAMAQNVAINADASMPDNSALLDLKSNVKGLLIPRMTQAERTAIPNPATSLMVYQTDGTTGFYFNAGTPGTPNWLAIGASQWLNNAPMIYYNGGNVGIGTNNPTGLLHLKGADWATQPMIIESSSPLNVGPALEFVGSSSHVYDIIGATGSGASTGADYFGIYDRTAAGYRFVISPTGEIGIGTIAPSINARLHTETNTHNYAGYFRNISTGISRYAVFATSNNGPGLGYGIRADGGFAGGYMTSDAPGFASVTYGVYGAATGSSGTRYGIAGFASGGVLNYAGYFFGNVHVNGTLSKLAGTFKIDHPLDPANKYLSHSFVESPDMMNVYTGVVTTGADGEAIATLPSYFEELNIQYTYQLTVIKQFAQAIIAEEIHDNQFTIKTDKPNVKVSWLVTGVRNDPYARDHRVVPEEEKRAEDKGKYLYPEGYHQSQDKAIAVPPQIKQSDK